MKHSSLRISLAAVALLATTAFAAGQNPPQQPAQAAQQQGGRPVRNFPAPTNLKVLPKDTTGRDVRNIMQKWAGSLGVQCETCHVADANNPGPNGRPRLNYADDSKPDKQIARIMYTMMQQINTDYISKTMDMDKDSEGSPVTCGTCHRGHQMPETFVIPREERGGPGGGQGMPGMPGKMPPDGAAPAPAGGTAPPPSN